MPSSLPHGLDVVLLQVILDSARVVAGGSLEGFDWLVRVLLQVDALKMGVPTLLALHVWLRPESGYRAEPVRTLRGVAGILVALGLGRAAQNWLPPRPRPRLALPDLPFPPLGHLDDLADWSSIPSDHAALAFALAAVAWSGSRRLGLLAGAWSLVMVCLPRLYFGYHYPSDILAGAALGILAVTLALRLPLPAGLAARAGERLRRLDARAPTLALLGLLALGAECMHLFQTTRRMTLVAAEAVQALWAPEPAMRAGEAGQRPEPSL